MKEIEGKTKSTLIFNNFTEKELEKNSFTNYFFVAGQRVASKKTGEEIKYHLSDLLGSTRMVLDSKGEVDNYTEYRPFGSTLYEKGSGKSPRHKYAGAIHDRETGLYQMGARYYNPTLGRFISPDPLFMLSAAVSLSSPLESGLYGYARNNPVNLVDPSGYGVLDPEHTGKAGSGNDTKENRDRLDEDYGNDSNSNDKDYYKEEKESVDSEWSKELVQSGANEVSFLGLEELANWGLELFKTNACGSNMSCETSVDIATIGLSLYGKKPGKAAKKASRLWTSTKRHSSAENAFNHWVKHGGDFPGLNNLKQYVEAAKKFLSAPPPGTKSKTRKNGDVVNYNPEKNIFGVKDKNGVPRTMYKPDPSKHGYPSNLDYFDAQ